MNIPQCDGCQRPLDRIDHVGIEHLILDQDTYREINGAEGQDDQPGVGSEVRLVCGYCLKELTTEQRQFFYAHWWQLKQFMADNHLTPEEKALGIDGK